MKISRLFVTLSAFLVMCPCPVSAGDEQAKPPSSEEFAQLGEAQQRYVTLALRYSELAKQVMEKLAGVTDKGTADAAAPELLEMAREMEALNEEVFHLLIDGDVSREEEKELCHRYITSADENLEHYKQTFDRLGELYSEEVDFYGSADLHEAVEVFAHALMIRTDTPNELVVRLYDYAACAILRRGEELAELLGAIKDRASADAAAPRIRELRQAKRIHEQAFAQLGELILSQDFATQIAIAKQFPGHEETVRRQQSLEYIDCLWLENQKPPFFGSEALKEAIQSTAPDSVSQEDQAL